jgi:hypothetical protein
LPQRGRAAAGASDKAGAAVRQHVERGPFISEHEGITQRERAHAGRPEQHTFGPPRDCGEQRQCVEAPIDEERVTAPNRIQRRTCFNRVGEREQIANAAKPEWHRAVRERDPEIHVIHDRLDR